MADVLQELRWWTVVERDTSAMCPHGHSLDKGLRDRRTRIEQRSELAAESRFQSITRGPTDRCEWADVNLTHATALVSSPPRYSMRDFRYSIAEVSTGLIG